MNQNRRNLLALAASAAASPLLFAAEGGFPTKAIKIVVPFSAGALTDIIARIYAAQLSPMLGQPVIVENKPGAGGITASQHVHRPPLTDEEKAKTPPVSHPALRTHPVSGRKAVYVGEGLTRTMEGMPEDEGRRLVVEISQFATQPQFVYRHKWRVNASHDGRGRDAALRARRPAHHQDKETRMKNYL